MTVRTLISQVTGQENLNFLLTNRVPRRWLTLFVGRLSKVRNPIVRETSIAIWISAKPARPALTACTTASSGS